MNSKLRDISIVCLLALAVVSLASSAGAGTPVTSQGFPPDDYYHSTLQGSYLDVEGSTNGLPDDCSDGRCGRYLVTIRNFANDVVAGANVVVDLSGCTDIQLSCDQLTAVTGQTLLPGKKVSGTTNALGQFVFRIQGASNAVALAGATSDGTNAGVPCALVSVEGVPLGTVIVSAYDINGTGSPGAAVNGADVSLASTELQRVALGAQARARDDYNHSNTITGADVSAASAMAIRAALGTGSQTTGPYCP